MNNDLVFNIIIFYAYSFVFQYFIFLIGYLILIVLFFLGVSKRIGIIF